MRVPTDEERAPAWLRTASPLVAAIAAIAIGSYFTYVGLDWQRHGCGCHRAWLPHWTWIAPSALALFFYAAGAALAWQTLRPAKRADT